ncbi:MAG: hypothetical protein J7641_15310 [Cyanobacteria bacterium SID2]|nr:hypothetical protein [Cyanobacteria bacterium SID2]MBP0004406.1 hypothetical protein [Cyanobacteria bacterium SBC]
MNTVPFDKYYDKIAVVLKQFRLKKVSENFFDPGRAEPYIISVAIDSESVDRPAIHFNALPFPNVRAKDTVSFDGQGHLIYGPKNPGEFVAYSILFMECDSDIRELGSSVERIFKSAATRLGLKTMLSINLSLGLATTVVGELASIVADTMKQNKDDELFRRNGTLLRDVTPPFDILRTYDSGNEYIDCQTSIVPLGTSNLLGSSVKSIQL